MRTSLFLAAGGVCVILAGVGLFVPILPTTPFLLLAAFFFARSSGRALHWLEHNRWFGEYIRNYRLGRGVRRRTRNAALFLLWLTIGFSALFLAESAWLRLLLAGIAVGVSIHLLKLPVY